MHDGGRGSIKGINSGGLSTRKVLRLLVIDLSAAAFRASNAADPVAEAPPLLGGRANGIGIADGLGEDGGRGGSRVDGRDGAVRVNGRGCRNFSNVKILVSGTWAWGGLTARRQQSGEEGTSGETHSCGGIRDSVCGEWKDCGCLTCLTPTGPKQRSEGAGMYNR